MASTFTDRNGTTHTLSITFLTVQQVADQLGIDLTRDFGRLQSLQDDTLGIARLLWIAAGSPDEFEDFAKAQNMQTIIDGTEALVEALADFLPSRTGKIIRKSQERVQGYRDAIYSEAERIVSRMV